MRSKLFTISLVLIALLSLAAVVHASTTVGPYPSTSPDSGTCGPDWANDAFARLFTDIVSTGFTEWFNNGTFVTVAGPSPNACNSGVNNGNTVVAGVTGTFSGSFDVAVTGATHFTPGACTQATCSTTAGFVHTVYGASANYDTGHTYFMFNYHKDCDVQTWQNASNNKGGNQGDITGGAIACPKPPAPQWFNPGDGRVDPRPGDRMVVSCETDRIVVYGVNDQSLGFLLTVFTRKETLTADKKGLSHDLGTLGIVSIAENPPTYFWLAWNGGKFHATGQQSWAKAFRCFSAQ